MTIVMHRAKLSYVHVIIVFVAVCCFYSENRLSRPENPQQLASAFSKVTILFLNKMALTWQEVGH